MDHTVAVTAGRGASWIGSLIPKHQQPCAAVGVAEIRVRKVTAPIDNSNHATAPGRYFSIRPPFIDESVCFREIIWKLLFDFRLGPESTSSFEAGHFCGFTRGNDVGAFQAAGGDVSKLGHQPYVWRRDARFT